MNEETERPELSPEELGELPSGQTEELPAELPSEEAEQPAEPEEGEAGKKPKEEKLPGTGAFEWVQCVVSALATLSWWFPSPTSPAVPSGSSAPVCSRR